MEKIDEDDVIRVLSEVVFTSERTSAVEALDKYIEVYGENEFTTKFRTKLKELENAR